jgi:hypothetical protein
MAIPIALKKWISKEQRMKRISSPAMILILLAVLASPLLAQEQDILGKKTPPLESLAAFASEESGIEPGAITISRKESQSLRQSRLGERLTLPALDQHIDTAAEPLQFQRIELFAPGARVMVMGAEGAEGAVEWQRDARQFYIASNSSTGVGLAVDAASGEISGFAIKGNSKLRLDGQLDVGIELQSVEEPADAVNSCGTQLEDQGPASINYLTQPIPESVSAAASGSAINFQAVVAIDTDNEWMAGKGNNPTTAMNWIADVFLAMNVFYERDVETRLLIGDVILRTSPDPYSEPSDRSAQLDEFAAHWRYNMGGTDRDFAALLSGRDVCSGCFSGIAWLNSYCNNGSSYGTRTVGSYSFNAIGSGRSAAGIAMFLGHEIGHNLGSPHTHCYNPVVDQCYSSESGCYSGAVSCPAGGKGTIMSYCHYSSGASCGTNKSEFHPRVQTLLESRLAANSPSCIAAYVEPPPPDDEIIFNQGFEPN